MSKEPSANYNTFPGTIFDMESMTDSSGEFIFDIDDVINEAYFEDNGIPYSHDQEGEFIPLTTEEQRLISEEILYLELHGDQSFDMGATVLFRNTKYLAPGVSIEFPISTTAAATGFSREEAELANRELGKILNAIAEKTGGFVAWRETPYEGTHHGSFHTTLLIPFSYAQSVAGNDYSKWENHLRHLLESQT